MPSPYRINISIGSRFVVDRKSLRKTAIESFQKHEVPSAQVDISVVGTRKMKELNALRGKDGATNVLSFTQRDPSEGDTFPVPAGILPHYGDIILCYPVLVEEAMKRNKLVQEILDHYVDHSIYHLLGEHYED